MQIFLTLLDKPEDFQARKEALKYINPYSYLGISHIALCHEAEYTIDQTKQIIGDTSDMLSVDKKVTGEFFINLQGFRPFKLGIQTNLADLVAVKANTTAKNQNSFP